MRKPNVLEFVSLDGVIQAPGGPGEDTSGGFAYGGWISPHSDPVSSTAIRKQMNMPFDLLIGRKTFDLWAKFWPQHSDIWPAVNSATKYVVSNTVTSHDCRWHDPGGIQGDGKHSHFERRHYRESRACRRSPNRKSINSCAVLSSLLSIFSVPDDYKVNDPEEKRRGLLLDISSLESLAKVTTSSIIKDSSVRY
jgi:hypothetical protein